MRDKKRERGKREKGEERKDGRKEKRERRMFAGKLPPRSKRLKRWK